MKLEKINWQKALQVLKNNQKIEDKNIIFDTPIHIHDVLFFNQKGIDIPEEFINYDDENIDCSDIPEITLEDVASNKLQRVLMAHIEIDNEIDTWIKENNINYEKLLSKLLKDFYTSQNSLQKSRKKL